MRRSFALATRSPRRHCRARRGGPIAPAVAASNFTFYGGGWGHGVGMSQYGAYGMAVNGAAYTEHPRAVLRRHGRADDLVAGDAARGTPAVQTSGRLQAIGGPVTLRLDSQSGAVIATIPTGQTWNVQFHADGRYWLRKPSGTFLGGHGWGRTERTTSTRFYDQAGRS